MTEAAQGPDLTITGDRELTEAEIEVFERDDDLEDPGVSVDQYRRALGGPASRLARRCTRPAAPDPDDSDGVMEALWPSEQPGQRLSGPGRA